MAVRGGWSAEEQFIKVAAQHFKETQDMVFINPPPPGLDVRHDLTGHVRLGELQFGGQLTSAPDFWPDLGKSLNRFNPRLSRRQKSIVAPWIIAPALIEAWLRPARNPA